MGTSFAEAFFGVSHLPYDKRLLIGQGFGADQLAWSSTSIDDIDFSEDFGEPTLARELQTMIGRFHASDTETAIAVVTAESGMATVMVIGVASVEQFEALIEECGERLVKDYVDRYLESRLNRWKASSK